MASRSNSLSLPPARGSVTPSPLITENGRGADMDLGGYGGGASRRASTTSVVADTGRAEAEARARAKEAEQEQEGDQDAGQTVKLTDFDVVETLGELDIRH